MKISDYKKEQRLPEIGTPCKTEIDLKDVQPYTGGFFVKEKNIVARKNAAGEYRGFVPGCGGDVWWIKHEDGTVGAYMFTEVFDQ